MIRGMGADHPAQAALSISGGD